MNHRADVFFLPVNAQSTYPNNASLRTVNAGQPHEEKTNFVCLGSRATKSLNHSNPVTAITDGDNLTLVMCSYSASSIFEFATSSSSGEIQVDSRPSLNRAKFPGRYPEFKKIFNGWRKTAAGKRPHRDQGTSTFRAVSRAANTTPKFTELNYLKTATSATSGLPASGSKRI
jgi:hypothetical protein